MHWTDDLKDTILREWGGTILFDNFEHTARSTAIFFLRLDFRICDHTCYSHGRSICTLIEHADHKFHLVNIYAPHTDTERRVYFYNISAFYPLPTKISWEEISTVFLMKNWTNPRETHLRDRQQPKFYI